MKESYEERRGRIWDATNARLQRQLQQYNQDSQVRMGCWLQLGDEVETGSVAESSLNDVNLRDVQRGNPHIASLYQPGGPLWNRK